MKLRLSLKWRKEAGQSFVELAVVLLLLVPLLLGTYDISRAMRAKNALINMSREGANQAQRGPRTSAAWQQIMSDLAHTAQPLQMETNGMMYLTEIKDKDGARTVRQEAWQRNPPGSCSNIDQSDPGTIPVAKNGSVCIFEVKYNYKSVLLPSYSPQLQATTAF